MLQFLLKRKSIIILSLLFFVSLTLFARNVEKREGGSLFNGVIVSLFAPFLSFSTHCIKEISDIWHSYFYLVKVTRENARLKKHIKNLQLENQLLREDAIENKRLRDLLAFKENLSHTFIPAAVIGRDPSSWFRTLLIDKGTAEGIRQGFAVITSSGLVGKIFEANKHTAKVLLIIDGDCAIDILVQRSRAKGIIEGGTTEMCELKYVSKKDDVRVGDVVVTSGLNDALPKGVVVGQVINVDKNNTGFFQCVEVMPAVNFSKLEEVLVVSN